MGWMLAAVAGYALLPWLIYSGTQTMSPWMFTGVWYVMYGALFAVFRLAASGDGSGAVVADLKAVRPWLFGLLAVFQLSWLGFAAAVRFADPSAVTVIFESWPLLFGLVTLTGVWRRFMLAGSSDAGDGSAASMLTMLAVGCVGVALVVLSDTGSVTWGSRTAWGLLIAGVSAVAAAAGLAVQQAVGKRQQPGQQRSMTAVSGSANAAAQAATVPLMAAVAVASGSAQVTAAGVLFAAATGAVHMAGNWCLHHANHLARERHGSDAAAINSLYYLVPAAALILLAVLDATDIDRPDLLIAGAAGVVAVNMVLHLDPEGTATRQGRGGHGYRSLVLAMWGAGVLVLFRDDWLPASWQAWSVVEYWGMIGVLATVFTLIYSFRQSRLAETRHACSDLLLSLHHRVDAMGRDGRLRRDDADRVTAGLRAVDSASRPDHLAAEYLSLRADLTRIVRDPSEHGSADERVGLLIDAERFVSRRQQGRGFAEPTVLAMFAAVTAAAAIVVRPAGLIVPFAGWAHDAVSMTVAAAFLFLGFDLMEKRHELDTPTLREVTDKAHEEHGQPRGWRLELAGYADHRAERTIAAALGCVLMIGAVGMLAAKWFS